MIAHVRTAVRVGASLLAGAIISVASLGGSDARAADCRSVYVIGNARKVVDCPTDQKFDFCMVRSSLVDRAGLLAGRLEFAGLARITGGTGDLAGYAGTVTDIGNTKGTVLITGTICKE